MFPARPSRASVAGRAILERSVVNIPDLELDPEYQPALARAVGIRNGLGVPMLRGGTAIGAIAVGRAEAGPFSDNQVALLQTFADQAVIAIENVRLFKELEGRNRDLTATSEILRVISRSPMDIQPVLETIAHNASRVCGASDTVVYLVEGDQMVRAAHRGPVPVTESSLGLPIERDYVSGLAVVECRTVHCRRYPDLARVSSGSSLR
jgi:putative methionine-R-sulfoxide reductase with GAF domain